MGAKNIIYPTFKDAQTLFAFYSTLESNPYLYKTLVDTIDSTFINNTSLQNVREMYNTIILKYYPNETCIKSSFINQILLKGKTHVTIFELPVGHSRVDLCKINGSSVAYEIKTDLDSLYRLNKQINDYMQIFEKTFVICSENKLTAVEQSIPKSCGIYIYSITKRNNIKYTLFRHALKSQSLNSEKQLCILSKVEINNHFHSCITNKLQSRKEINKYILDNYSSEYINHHFKRMLKYRYQQKWDFLKNNHSNILEIDYQWFFKNPINPNLIYN